MRGFLIILLCLALAVPVGAATGHVYKVLPQFLDEKGRESLTPSLYDRDAYQAMLRKNPAKRSGLRFAVQWKSNAPKSDKLKLRVELRSAVQGGLPGTATLELPLTQRHWFSHWESLALTGEDYKSFGNVTAWRATLWDGDQLLDEQKSFLW